MVCPDCGGRGYYERDRGLFRFLCHSCEGVGEVDAPERDRRDDPIAGGGVASTAQRPTKRTSSKRAGKGTRKVLQGGI